MSMKILISNQQDKKISVKKVKDIVKKIIRSLSCPDEVEISILFTDDNFIKGLNKKYLKKNKPTDVLSFPMFSPKEIDSQLTTHNSRLLLGDIVISVDTAKKQAVLQKNPLADEITRLLIHGILHLLGYEHEKGGKKAVEMKKEERRLIDLLNV